MLSPMFNLWNLTFKRRTLTIEVKLIAIVKWILIFADINVLSTEVKIPIWLLHELYGVFRQSKTTAQIV